MRASQQPTPFGRISPPDGARLGKHPPEPILDPDLPLIDPHHHLWHRPGHRYVLDDFLADVRTGHHVVATVFEACHAMYRASGPEELRPVGETECVAGMAAMRDSGLYGPTRVAAGIVGFADLTLGDRVEPVLEAHIRVGGGRFRSVRYSAGWDANERIGNSRTATGPHVLRQAHVRVGLARLTALDLAFDAWIYHPQLADVIDLARAFPTTTTIMCHVDGPLGYGPYAGKQDEVFASWKSTMTEPARCQNVVIKLGGMLNRLAASDFWARPAPILSTELAEYWRSDMGTYIELFGLERCMFESNCPVEKMGVGWVTLWSALKRIAAGASPEAKRFLFSDTAQHVYNPHLE